MVPLRVPLPRVIAVMQPLHCFNGFLVGQNKVYRLQVGKIAQNLAISLPDMVFPRTGMHIFTDPALVIIRRVPFAAQCRTTPPKVQLQRQLSDTGKNVKTSLAHIRHLSQVDPAFGDGPRIARHQMVEQSWVGRDFHHCTLELSHDWLALKVQKVQVKNVGHCVDGKARTVVLFDVLDDASARSDLAVHGLP